MNDSSQMMTHPYAADPVGPSERAHDHLRPTSVTVVRSDDTFVITLHGALSRAESFLAKSANGAASVENFHRAYFASHAKSIRSEIERITGVEVRQAPAEIELSAGAIVAVFTTGKIVQVFTLKSNMLAESWNAGWSE